MRKFALGLSQELVLECKNVILNNNMDISRFKVYIQGVKYEKKKHADISKRKSMKVWYSNYDGGQ